MRLPLGWRVAGGADRAVSVVIKSLAIVAGVDAWNGDPLWLIVFDLVLPLAHPLFPVRRGMTQAGLQIAHLPREICRQHLLLGRVGDHRSLVIVVQERKEPVILLLRQRIVLMVVALRAS